MAELLARAWCVVCGAPVAALPSQWARAKCTACGRVGFGASSEARAPWRPTIPIVRPNARLVSPADADQPVTNSAGRVLIAARPATAGEVPRAAGQLAELIPGATLTYALAEVGQGFVHSLCVRVVDEAGRRLGYQMWINSQAKGGVWWPSCRRVHLDEFTALATGAPHVPRPTAQPAPVGPCPRCGREVRWTLAGAPYAHTRPPAAREGGQTTKESCR